MFFNRCFENENMEMNKTMTNNFNDGGCCCTNVCPPVMECPQERVCHRQMCYEVPHVCPFM